MGGSGSEEKLARIAGYIIITEVPSKCKASYDDVRHRLLALPQASIVQGPSIAGWKIAVTFLVGPLDVEELLESVKAIMRQVV